MRIDSAIIEVLAKAEVSGNTLRLTEQLDRKTYQQVSDSEVEHQYTFDENEDTEDEEDAE